jgi:predicted unusual protein kinase regulating ubiquinone biosynthesis (AarF/ABC1/UbiB family)
MRRLSVVAAVGAVAGLAVAARRRIRRDGAVVGAVAGVGVASRNARLATMGARAGRSYAMHATRRAVASPERRAELDAEQQLRTATQVAEALGEMKGALMKIGQMASYLDDGMPAPVREALASLQQDARPMSPELCASVVRSELGDAPEHVFASWDPVPVAAASIGQVHRAVTRSGLEVAVKVQYPGVDDAIRADLVNTDLIFRVLSMLFPGLDTAPLVEELRARLTEELDYEGEAANQRQFARFYAGHPFIHVPAVIDELSTRRVLTTEFVDGARFAEIETWPQEQRDQAGEAIFRFVFRSIYRMHAFNGDPHPGNYLFHGDGKVSFLDFGLVKHYTARDVELFESLIKALVADRDVQRFRTILERHHVLRPDPTITDDEVSEYFGHFYEMVLDDAVVEVTPEYASETVRRMFDLGGPYAHIAKTSNLPPAFVITQRINLGLTAILGQLGARANWRRVAEELWPFVGGPPSTPMGEAEAAWLATRN